jgi:hypothetical protein
LKWKIALEHHDSAPEDQLKGWTGCDLDHIILINRQAWPSCAGQSSEKGASCGFCWTIGWNPYAY